MVIPGTNNIDFNEISNIVNELICVALTLTSKPVKRKSFNIGNTTKEQQEYHQKTAVIQLIQFFTKELNAPFVVT